jgi:transposase
MDENIPVKPPVKRSRRYSKTFKDRIIAACDRPGVSVAGVALANGLNASLVHKWRRLAKAGSLNQPEQPGFLSIPMAMMGNHPSECP